MLSLARAMYKQSSIYIFDEPTMSLDINSEKSTIEIFKKFSKNSISIMISHRLSYTKIVDRIIVMDKGKIIEEGNHNYLMDKNNLYKKCISNKQRNMD